MLINLHPDADVARVVGALTALGVWPKPLKNADGVVQSIYVGASSTPVNAADLNDIPGVVGVLQAESPHPLVDASAQRPAVVGSVDFLGEEPILLAGPCGLDSEEAVFTIAAEVAAAGARVLRGGAFKPRTSPYAFSGYGLEALGWMSQAAAQHGLAMVSEVLSEMDVPAVAERVDMIQIGSRNMQNFALLKAVGEAQMPVLLKRGRAATIDEWLMAGEHLYSHGASLVVFCERGVRGFDSHTRNLLDLAAVSVLRYEYGLPVVVDPSHGTGRRDLIVPLAHAAVAAGAHGVMVEVNPAPETARSDGPQAIDFAGLRALSARLGLGEE